MTKHHNKNPFSSVHISIPAPKQFTSSITHSIPVISKATPILPVINHITLPVQAPKLTSLNHSIAQISHQVSHNIPITNKLPSISNIVSKPMTYISNPIKNVSKNAFTAINHDVSNPIKNVSKNAFTTITKTANNSINTVSNGVNKSINTVSNGVNQSINTVANSGGLISNGLTTAIGGLATGLAVVSSNLPMVNADSDSTDSSNSSNSLLIPAIAVGSLMVMYFMFSRR